MRATSRKLNIVVEADGRGLAERAAELFFSDARRAMAGSGRFCVAVSRDTPGSFFELLGGQSRFDNLRWQGIHLFWVDECCGPAKSRSGTGDLSAYGSVGKTHIPAENVHRICLEKRNCACAASIYEQTILNLVSPGENGMPCFDLIMLKMDSDGHIASLFPDTYGFFDTEDSVCVMYFMDGRYTRITLTNPVLCAASHIVILVCGKESGAILREILTSEPDEVRYPLHAVWPILDKVTWLVDRNAGGFLKREQRERRWIAWGLESLRRHRRS
ncbi:MAG TPA: 6-phosphogluconolactonase [Sedimentisphaerales bacterium]|nr:6-phosphogluconolactonase [Sedimentisphaerales bacterium]